jgi:hypothetical protein
LIFFLRAVAILKNTFVMKSRQQNSLEGI